MAPISKCILIITYFLTHFCSCALPTNQIRSKTYSAPNNVWNLKWCCPWFSKLSFSLTAGYDDLLKINLQTKNPSHKNIGRCLYPPCTGLSTLFGSSSQSNLLHPRKSFHWTCEGLNTDPFCVQSMSTINELWLSMHTHMKSTRMELWIHTRFWKEIICKRIQQR